MAIRTITVDNISYPIANDKVTQVEIAPNAATSSTTSFPMIFSPANASITTNVTDELQKSRNLRFSPSNSAVVLTGGSGDNSGRFQIQDENNRQYAFLSKYVQGTTSTVGLSILSLGNNTASGQESNAQGQIQIYGTGTKPNIIKSGAGNSSDREDIIPDVSGYFAIGVTTGVGGVSTPIYMNSSGELTSVTLKSASQNLLNSLDEATSTVGTTTYVITNGGSASYTTNFYKRPISSVVSSANVKAALGTTTTTANKVLSDTGAWVDPDIYSFKLQGGTEIPEGASLNAYSTPGNYLVSKTITAQTILNNPFSAAASTSMSAFRLYVVNSLSGTSYRWQILRFYNKVEEWRRYSTDGGSAWTAWTNIAVDEKVDQNVTDTNAAYPVLLGAISGATTTYNGEARYSVRASVNALTGQFISNARPSSDIGVGGGYDIYNANGKISSKLWLYSNGTASAVGWSGLQVGNDTASGTAGNEQGFIYLYSSGAGKHQIDSAYTTGTGYFHLPNISGTAAMLEGAQTFDGVKTFATTVYFANGTTYYIGSTGNAKVNTLTSAGAATFSSTSTHTGAATFNNKIIGKSGAVSAGNYTTTVPTTAGTTGQIMFVLST